MIQKSGASRTSRRHARPLNAKLCRPSGGWVLWVAAALLWPAGQLRAQEPDYSHLLSVPPWAMSRLDMQIDLRGDLIRATGVIRLHPGVGTQEGVIAIQKPAQFESLSIRGARSGATIQRLDGAIVADAAKDYELGLVRIADGDSRPLDVSFAVRHPGGRFLALMESGIALAQSTSAWHPSPGGGGRVAPGTTTFLLPADWHALSGGERVSSRVENGYRTEVFEASEPIGRSFVAGPFEVHRQQRNDRSFAVYQLAGSEVSAPTVAAAADAILSATEPRFGRYPYSTISVAEVPSRLRGWLAASAEGFIMVQQDLLAGPTGANIPMIAHELGHGWWRSDKWRSRSGVMIAEGLSQYVAVTAIEQLEGVGASTVFLESSRENFATNQCAKGYFDLWREGHDRPLAALAGARRANDLADSKGMWVYHMLRRQLGDDPFYSTLRRLFEQGAFRRGEVGLEDLLGHFSSAMADPTLLESFLAQWFDRAGAPIIEVELGPGQASGTRVCLRQRTTPFQLDNFSLAVSGRQYQLDVRGELSCLDVEGRIGVDEIELDPDREFLIWRPEYGPAPGTP